MKRIESPSKKWAGYVVLHDPLNLEQVIAIEDAQDEAVALEPSRFLQKINEDGNLNISVTWSSHVDKIILPVIVLCVAEWHLTDFPETPNLGNIPSTPRKEAHLLVDWLWTEINKIYAGNVDIPNES